MKGKVMVDLSSTCTSSLVVDATNKARDKVSDTVSRLYLALQSTVQVRPGAASQELTEVI